MEKMLYSTKSTLSIHFIRVAPLRKLPGYRCARAAKGKQPVHPRVGLSQTATHGQMFGFVHIPRSLYHKPTGFTTKIAHQPLEIVCRHCKYSRWAIQCAAGWVFPGDRRRNNGTLPIPKAPSRRQCRVPLPPHGGRQTRWSPPRPPVLGTV
jgi:hypothetical protein